MHKPSVPEQLMHSTVRIECEDESGRTSTGTGFFYRFLEENGQHIPAIVTNKHVVQGAVKGSFHLTQKNDDGSPRMGDHLKMEFGNFGSQWIGHPDDEIDLAIFPIAPIINKAQEQNVKFYYVALDESIRPGEEQIEDLTGLDEIVMVGYPNALWDSRNNLPLFRSGTTATHPRYDYEGKPYFLIDCACFPGSSGSPVFVYNAYGWKDRHGNMNMGQERILLLGVLFAGPQHIAEGEVEIIEAADLASVARSVASIPNNLGVVVKSRELVAFEDVLQERLRNA